MSFVSEKYMREVEKYPLLTHERVLELANIIHSPTSSIKEKDKAKQEMIEGNLKLVVKIAIQLYPSVPNGSYLTIDDLIQAGNIALTKIVNRYRADKNTKFSTFAYLYIQRKIQRAIRISKFIRMPPTHLKWVIQLKELEDKYGNNISEEYVAQKLNISVPNVQLIKQSQVEVYFYDIQLNEYILKNYVEEHGYSEQEFKEFIYKKIKELKPSYRNVILNYFMKNKEVTMEQIGSKNNVCRQNVKQLLVYALRQLKRKIISEININKTKKGKNEK